MSCRGGPLPKRVASPPKLVASGGVYHQVQRGQTLWSIAKAYGVDIKTLRRANRVANTHVLRVGQRLYIPGATQLRSVASRCPCGDTALHPKRPSVTQPSRLPHTAAIPRDQVRPEQRGFLWPLQGKITRTFQPSGKRRHDGVDIAAPRGTSIRAAANGEVVFSDWGPGGYGRIVILRHEAGLVTVYAHNHRNLVRAGQTVRRGDHIATVGRSGRATGYHLHFEVRRQTVPVSPFKFLSHQRRVASSKTSNMRNL